MEIDTSSLSAPERYKLLVGLVFPRPIALVSTRSENGVANCAPYSFFNAICEDPMLVILSFSRRSDGRMKHSLANLLRTGGFVVNMPALFPPIYFAPRGIILSVRQTPPLTVPA